MSANTGGPASGKTLLDEFAGQALAGLCSSWYDRHKDDPLTQRGHGPTLISQSAYTHADAMLAEKARREATGKYSLQVPDHSPDAGKMAEMQAANMELVEALRLAVTHVEFFTSPPKGSIAEVRRNALLLKFSAILAKHKGAK